MRKTDHSHQIDKRKPIERMTLAKKATIVIRRMIIKGELPPGVKITEFSLADAVGVSRACIREALIVLAQEGLLTRIQNHYTQVVRFTAIDISEIAELRLTLETMALHKCIEQKSLCIQSLDGQLEKLVELSVLKSENNVIAWLEEDMAFHRMIVAAAKNNRAIKLWDSLSHQVVALLYRAYQIYPNLISFPADTHSKIIQAIRQGNRAVAEKCLQHHILFSIDWSKKAVEAQGERDRSAQNT